MIEHDLLPRSFRFYANALLLLIEPIAYIELVHQLGHYRDVLVVEGHSRAREDRTPQMSIDADLPQKIIGRDLVPERGVAAAAACRCGHRKRPLGCQVG